MALREDIPKREAREVSFISFQQYPFSPYPSAPCFLFLRCIFVCLQVLQECQGVYDIAIAAKGEPKAGIIFSNIPALKKKEGAFGFQF